VNLFKRVISLVLVLITFVGVMSIGINTMSAEALTDAEKQEIIDKINSLQQKSEDLQKDIDVEKSKLNDQNKLEKSYEQQIALTQQKIDACNQFINMCNNQIKESEDKIASKNEEIADTKERFKKRIRSLYMSNTDSSLQLLMGAESFADYLSLAELSKYISAQDTKLVDELVSTISEIQEEIKKNEDLKSQKAEIKKTLAAERAVLDGHVASVNKVISSINSTKGNLEAQQKAYENDKKALENSLLSIDPVNIAFDGVFQWPIPGFRMTSPWMSGDSVHKGDHKGIDLGARGINGESILCAAKGTVSKVVNSCPHDYGKKSSCGCGGGYGNHVRVTHGLYKGQYYMTIYAHMRKAIVSYGQSVLRAQVLGYVGSTGWSTNWHLHFGVARGTNPNSLYWEDPMKFTYINK
jgi:murein DD-endopeptidase MepM/ murein hydrolase activator NlpD